MHNFNGLLDSVEVGATIWFVVRCRTVRHGSQDYKGASIVHFSERQRNELLHQPAIFPLSTNVKAQRHLSSCQASLIPCFLRSPSPNATPGRWVSGCLGAEVPAKQPDWERPGRSS